MSGHHANIEKWRREQSVIRTAKNRPDLLEKAELTEKKKTGRRSAKEVKNPCNLLQGMIKCSML